MIYGDEWDTDDRLTLDRYQINARKTANLSHDPEYPQVAVLALGLAGEAGEVADYIKKVIGHGHILDRDKLISELGDTLWYCAMLADFLEIKLSEVAVRNNEKLAKRYPNGFESERSINRTKE